MTPVENNLEMALRAACEAHLSGYAHGMEHVVRHIEDAMSALDDVVWGDLEEPMSFSILETLED